MVGCWRGRLAELIVTGEGGGGGEVVFVCWLLNVPATCECISGIDLLGQFYVPPH